MPLTQTERDVLASAMGDAPLVDREGMLKSALSRAKTRAAPGKVSWKPSTTPGATASTSPATDLPLPAPLAEVNDSRQAAREVRMLHGHDIMKVEGAHLGILTGLGKELADKKRVSGAGSLPEPAPESSSSSSTPARPKKKVEEKKWDSGLKTTEEALGEDAARIDGVWQTDSSQHTQKVKAKASDPRVPSLKLAPQAGNRSIRVLYLFSGVSRRASIAESLRALCTKDGIGLDFFDVDIHVGGSAHDLLDREVQEDYMNRILEGDFDFVILSPPCGSWSRANWANADGPPPCRDRFHPWGYPDNSAGQRRRAEHGNEFVHFSIRAIQSAQLARKRGCQVRCLLEHPEDLGRVGKQALFQGVPASIWQLDELRTAFGESKASTAAGWQCQYPGVDYAKPTRLWSDIPGVEGFGRTGWPVLDSDHQSRGPLPRHCGHSHKTATIGKNKAGGFNVSPTAAYPPPICEWIANLIYEDWKKSPTRLPRGGGTSHASQASRLVRNKVSKEVSRTSRWSPWASESGEATTWQGTSDIVPAELIERETAAADARGADHCIKDGIDAPIPEPSSEEDKVHSWRKVGDSGDETTDCEKELGDIPRPRRGAGHWGRGPPLHVARKGIHRDMVDGVGLCSPGRWPKARRNLPQDGIASVLRDVLLNGLKRCEKQLPGGSYKATLHAIIGGKLEKSPFAEKVLEVIRTDLRVALKRAGYGDGLPREGDRVQAVEVRLVQALLHAFGDPDVLFCDFWSRGVWLGSQTRKLPRAPAIFDRKVKWKFPEATEPLHGEWQTNYPSLREHAATVNRQFEAEESEGLMMRMTLREAIARFGDSLLITATGAIEKKGREGEVRVIFDASRGVLVNLGIRVRDQVKCPASGDAKVVLREIHGEGGTHIALVYDVSKAHRRVPVLEEEWGRQACQVRGTAASASKNRQRMADANSAEGKPTRVVLKASEFTEEELDQSVWVNTVGTFGVASAGYWWGRAGAAVMRLAHYLQGRDRALWLLLYSDDSWATAQGEQVDRNLLLHLLVLGVLGTPLAWHKLKAGHVLEWIGYAVDVARFQIGITEKRVHWAIRWIEDKVREGSVRLGELREGLGRLQFVAGPLEHLRPFLGPLYAWASAGHKFARPRLPVMIRLVLEFLAKELAAGGMISCATGIEDIGEVFRLDAKAEGDTVAIGGWRCSDVSKTKDAVWFAVSLNRRNAPWAFQKGEAFRTIASLELLGVLVGLMVLAPTQDANKVERTGLITLSCGTDNLGNTFLLDRLLTTKYPLGVVLMEVAHQCRCRGLALRANWVPRLENQEADDLTNLEFKSFDESKRLDVDLDCLDFGVMRELFEVGDNYLAELTALKEEAKRTAEVRGNKKRKKAGDALRDREPW